MAMKKDLPTVAQLAQAAGVSPATVSRVLNHKGIVKADTYNRVVAVLQAKGYPFVEKAGRADPSDVLMISLPSLDNPFYADIVRGAKSGATRHGYHLIINESHINRNTLPGILELVHSLRISGLITVNHISTDILHTLSNVVPLVQCCEYAESTDLPPTICCRRGAGALPFSAGRRAINMRAGACAAMKRRCGRPALRRTRTWWCSSRR